MTISIISQHIKLMLTFITYQVVADNCNDERKCPIGHEWVGGTTHACLSSNKYFMPLSIIRVFTYFLTQFKQFYIKKITQKLIILQHHPPPISYIKSYQQKKNLIAMGYHIVTTKPYLYK